MCVCVCVYAHAHACLCNAFVSYMKKGHNTILCFDLIAPKKSNLPERREVRAIIEGISLFEISRERSEGSIERVIDSLRDSEDNDENQSDGSRKKKWRSIRCNE